MMYWSGLSDIFFIAAIDLVRHFVETRVDQQRPLLAHLKRDIGAIAHQHVDIALHGPHVELGLRKVGVLLAMAFRRGHGSVWANAAPASTPMRKQRATTGSGNEESSVHARSSPLILCRAALFFCAAAAAIAFSFRRYSGYMVSAPPLAAS